MSLLSSEVRKHITFTFSYFKLTWTFMMDIIHFCFYNIAYVSDFYMKYVKCELRASYKWC